MKKLLKRSFVVAALWGAAAVTLQTAQADPLSYKTRPGTSGRTSPTTRTYQAPSSSYRSFSYAPSTSSATRSFSYAPGAVRSYSYAPAAPQTMRSYSYQPGSAAPQGGVQYRQNPCYCAPR